MALPAQPDMSKYAVNRETLDDGAIAISILYDTDIEKYKTVVKTFVHSEDEANELFDEYNRNLARYAKKHTARLPKE